MGFSASPSYVFNPRPFWLKVWPTFIPWSGDLLLSNKRRVFIWKHTDANPFRKFWFYVLSGGFFYEASTVSKAWITLEEVGYESEKMKKTVKHTLSQLNSLIFSSLQPKKNICWGRSYIQYYPISHLKYHSTTTRNSSSIQPTPRKGRKVGDIRYEARSRGRSSPDSLAFWACETPRR